MIKKTALALAFAALASLLCGCLKPVSLDAYGYVITMGVDKGTEKKYYFTFALQRELAEQDISSEGGAIALSAEGSDVFEAMNEIEGNIPYSLNFSRTGFIVVSRELAEEGALEELVGTSFDSLKIRTSAAVLVCEDDAGRFVGGMYSNNDANISKLQSALMLDKKKTGMVNVMSVSRLLEATGDGRFDFCSAYGRYDDSIITDMSQKKAESEGENPLKDVGKGMRAGGLKSVIDGAAIFSGWRMTGTLSREETMLLNMATGEFESGVVSFDLGEKGVRAILLTLRSSKKKARLTDKGGLEAECRIMLDASMHLVSAGTSSREADEWITKEVPRLIEEKLRALFYKCRSASSDAMRFGVSASKLFRSASAWESFDLKAAYSSLEPVFTVEVRNVDKYVSEDMQ